MSEFSLKIMPDQWGGDFFTIMEIKFFSVFCALELKTEVTCTESNKLSGMAVLIKKGSRKNNNAICFVVSLFEFICRKYLFDGLLVFDNCCLIEEKVNVKLQWQNFN